MLPQRSRKQTIKMITLVSNTHSELLFFKRPNVSLFHHSGSSYSRWWKHAYLSKLSHFAALLADCKSCLPLLPVKDDVFAGKLLWCPHTSSCATLLGTTGQEEEQGCTLIDSLPLPCSHCIGTTYTRGFKICWNSWTSIKAWNKFSLLPANTQ